MLLLSSVEMVSIVQGDGVLFGGISGDNLRDIDSISKHGKYNYNDIVYQLFSNQELFMISVCRKQTLNYNHHIFSNSLVFLPIWDRKSLLSFFSFARFSSIFCYGFEGKGEGDRALGYEVGYYSFILLMWLCMV